MARLGTVFSLQSFLALPLAGCLEDGVSENKKIEAEELIEVDNPCSMPSEPITVDDNNTSHGVDRYFRLTVPSSEIGVKLPIVWPSTVAVAQRKISHNKMNSML